MSQITLLLDKTSVKRGVTIMFCLCLAGKPDREITENKDIWIV
jgi:hypothetical protein